MATTYNTANMPLFTGPNFGQAETPYMPGEL